MKIIYYSASKITPNEQLVIISQSSIHGIEGIKQKRKHLSIDQKVDLTEKAERGYSVTRLAQEFNIGKATICDIKKQKDNIKKFFAQTHAIGNRKTLKPAKYMDLDSSALTGNAFKETLWPSGLRKSIPGCKVKKERFSALLCCNADGSHRTTYAIVGKSANLRALKNCMIILPVIYYNTKNAWFTQITFEDWFQNHFCKEVKKQQINMCRIHPAEVKAMLLTDNAPAHPNAKLTSPDGKITCMALPPNTTSVVQPMD
ncbi:tigger transposable element-derived protein 7-like [Procambarus clarkii]|uniref:tigger transposable element-derived protein 7-like n=1 Tax=Procambarus clarkii TaxID=6728 RepID=UPI003744B1E8